MRRAYSWKVRLKSRQGKCPWVGVEAFPTLDYEFLGHNRIFFIIVSTKLKMPNLRNCCFCFKSIWVPLVILLMISRRKASHFACIKSFLTMSVDPLGNLNVIWTPKYKSLLRKTLSSYLMLVSSILSRSDWLSPVQIVSKGGYDHH